MPPFVDAITFGPFSAEYHRWLVDEHCRRALAEFIAEQVMPQVDHPVSETAGALTAVFDEDRYCGPTSLVRDLFHFSLEMKDVADISSLKTDLAYEPAKQQFKPRTGHRIYVWTPTRKRKRDAEWNSIKRVVSAIRQHQIATAECPICGKALFIVNDKTAFVVQCPQRCFRIREHWDGAGGFISGSSSMAEPRIS